MILVTVQHLQHRLQGLGREFRGVRLQVFKFQAVGHDEGDLNL